MRASEDKGKATAAELRRTAEEELQKRTTGLKSPRTDEATQKLVHELEVHQIELEMQNEELIQARAEVDRTLDMYTDLYDFAPVGYFTLDHAGIIKAVNISGASLFGIERSRLLNRRFRDFLPINARPFFADFLGKVLAQQGKESCEIPLTKEGNHPLFVQVEGLADASGKECRIAVIDITERRLAEAEISVKKLELEEVNKSLEVRISEAIDELRKKDQILIMQDRLAVLGEMINNIAHQWNQPLNTLGLVVQQFALYYDLGQLSEKFIKENIEKAMELIQHMSQTIEDFRSLFKDGKEPISFDVYQVIMRTLSLLEKIFEDQKIGIAIHNDGNPAVSGFPNEYSQVLMNILLNARDALIEHNVDDALISIHAFADGDKSVVTISDNAGGIAEEIMDKLFDPFFTTKGPEKGTGIGLFMSKTIIEKSMGGKLTVRNNGGGAEFRITQAPYAP